MSLGLPDDTWVEVMRIDRIDLEKHVHSTTCTVGQLWLFLSPGSGIWWNTGRSLKALTPSSATALWSQLPAGRPGGAGREHTRPCSIYHDQGYDSIQVIARPAAPALSLFAF